MNGSEKRGFGWGYFWIITSILSIFSYTNYLFDGSVDLIYKLTIVLIGILTAIAIFGAIKRKRWAFYYLLPNLFIGIVPILLMFQSFLNIFNDMLNFNQEENSKILSFGTIAIPFYFTLFIYSISCFLLVKYLSKRLEGKLLKPAVAAIIILSILFDIGVIFHYQKTFYDKRGGVVAQIGRAPRC